MPRIDDLRANLQPTAAPRSSAVILLASAFGAFVVGGLVVVGWQALQPSAPSVVSRLMPSSADFSFSTGTARIGQATTAPLLQRCIWNIVSTSPFGARRGVRRTNSIASNLEPSAIYAMLKAGTLQIDVNTALGISDAQMSIRPAIAWGNLAECIYAQESRELCDSDNRAAAVETATRFLRHAKQALASTNKTTTTAIQHMQQINAVKDRLLIMLKSHGYDGSMVASDFGFFPPDEIARAMRGVKATKNACAGLTPAAR